MHYKFRGKKKRRWKSDHHGRLQPSCGGSHISKSNTCSWSIAKLARPPSGASQGQEEREGGAKAGGRSLLGPCSGQQTCCFPGFFFGLNRQASCKDRQNWQGIAPASSLWSNATDGRDSIHIVPVA